MTTSCPLGQTSTDAISASMSPSSQSAPPKGSPRGEQNPVPRIGDRHEAKHTTWETVCIGTASCDKCVRQGRGILKRCKVCKFSICVECSEAGHLSNDERHILHHDEEDWSRPVATTRKPRDRKTGAKRKRATTPTTSQVSSATPPPPRPPPPPQVARTKEKRVRPTPQDMETRLTLPSLGLTDRKSNRVGGEDGRAAGILAKMQTLDVSRDKSTAGRDAYQSASDGAPGPGPDFVPAEFLYPECKPSPVVPYPFGIRDLLPQSPYQGQVNPLANEGSACLSSCPVKGILQNVNEQHSHAIYRTEIAISSVHRGYVPIPQSNSPPPGQDGRLRREAHHGRQPQSNTGGVYLAPTYPDPYGMIYSTRYGYYPRPSYSGNAGRVRPLESAVGFQQPPQVRHPYIQQEFLRGMPQPANTLQNFPPTVQGFQPVNAAFKHRAGTPFIGSP
jgi:hypothetical protein